MDDNVWEYPFGDLDDDEEIFYRKPRIKGEERDTEQPAVKPQSTSKTG